MVHALSDVHTQDEEADKRKRWTCSFWCQHMNSFPYVPTHTFLPLHAPSTEGKFINKKDSMSAVEINPSRQYHRSWRKYIQVGKAHQQQVWPACDIPNIKSKSRACNDGVPRPVKAKACKPLSDGLIKSVNIFLSPWILAPFLIEGPHWKLEVLETRPPAKMWIWACVRACTSMCVGMCVLHLLFLGWLAGSPFVCLYGCNGSHVLLHFLHACVYVFVRVCVR